MQLEDVCPDSARFVAGLRDGTCSRLEFAHFANARPGGSQRRNSVYTSNGGGTDQTAYTNSSITLRTAAMHKFARLARHGCGARGSTALLSQSLLRCWTLTSDARYAQGYGSDMYTGLWIRIWFYSNWTVRCVSFACSARGSDKRWIWLGLVKPCRAWVQWRGRWVGGLTPHR